MTVKSMSPLLVSLFLTCALSGPHLAASTNVTSISSRRIRVIEFGDHPDPNTGPPGILETTQPWPLEVQALESVVEARVGRNPSVFDIRQDVVSVDGTETLEETTVKILDVTAESVHMSVILAAAPKPIEISIPTNASVVIGSESNDQ